MEESTATGRKKVFKSDVGQKNYKNSDTLKCRST